MTAAAGLLYECAYSHEICIYKAFFRNRPVLSTDIMPVAREVKVLYVLVKRRVGDTHIVLEVVFKPEPHNPFVD